MAKKKKKAKVDTKRTAKKAVKAAKKVAKAEKKAAKKVAQRRSWLDEAGTPLIDDYARKLESFVRAMADGKVEESEIEAQERRLAKLMKNVEPMLNDGLHASVTELLCELTAYDLMQTLFMMQQARPTSTTLDL